MRGHKSLALSLQRGQPRVRNTIRKKEKIEEKPCALLQWLDLGVKGQEVRQQRPELVGLDVISYVRHLPEMSHPTCDEF